MKHAFTATILRYVHDTVSGEFVNVGVALFSPSAPFAGAICRETYSRLTKFFPSADGESFKAMVRHIGKAFSEINERLVTNLPDLERPPADVLELARAVLPTDASSLQWSPVRAGLTEDPAATLENLYERLVSRYESRSPNENRSNEDVWRTFKRSLETRNVLRHFKSKVIASESDDMEFKHAYKNGIWHCLEPLSLDLSTADGIKDKARTLVGRMLALQPANERFKLYLLVGKPRTADLMPEYEKAVAILNKLPVENGIYPEECRETLGEDLARIVS